MRMSAATSLEIKNIVMEIKSNASGCDELPSSIIKLVIDHILDPLTYLVNLSLKTVIFPTAFKEAKVIALTL